LPQAVYVDRDMWEKIVLNLMSNAFKFTFKGEVTVETQLSHDHSGAEITVGDTGTGIPADEVPHLFERRVENARGRSIEGSGIGLALVQELVIPGGLATLEHVLDPRPDVRPNLLPNVTGG
jgi:signal transduction histidine kinase